MDDETFRRLRQVIWAALARWEASGAQGSARPIFDRAWHNALRLEQLATAGQKIAPPLAMVRERLWTAWVGQGELTHARRNAILASRPEARAMLTALGLASREPGEEG